MFVRNPTAGGTMTMSTVALANLAMLPSAQVTIPPASLQLPWLGVAETNVTPAGSEFERLTPCALFGPLLVTVMVKVRSFWMVPGFGEAANLTARSATGLTVVGT